MMVTKGYIFTCLLVIGIQQAYCQQEKVAEDYLYKDLPFKMEKVKQPVFATYQVDITTFGAKNDGVTSNTKAFAAAITEVAKKGGGTVVVPEGIWLTGPIVLQSNINLHTEKGALIVYTKNYDEYPLVKTFYEGQTSWRAMSPIYAVNAENIAITGEGVFDGSGEAWRPMKKAFVDEYRWKSFVSSGGILREDGNLWFPNQSSLDGSMSTTYPGLRTKEESEAIKVFLRPVLVNLVNCKKILVEGVTFQNSPAWCLHPLLSEDITIRNVKVANQEWMANGDALDLESCRNVLIYNSIFDAGDDAICMKSGRDEEGRKRGVPTENVIISNCLVYHGHGGFVVGSEMSGGVRNIKVSHCTFMGTDVGLRFKSRRGRGGIVENIYISDINMINIEREAILYDLYYQPNRTEIIPEHASETTPQFKNIFMKNIVCKGAGRAILFQGLPEMSLKNVSLENAVIEAQTGVICVDADQITMKNVEIYTKALPVIDIENAVNIKIENFKCLENQEAVFYVKGEKSNNILFTQSIKNSQMLKINPNVKPNAVKIVQ
jgi:polygalacturonase